MARRMMDAYRKLGCEPSWTCAPYQAGHRPALGSDVAWGESNAVVFCNSVLGARTNRYGDFLDIACAISGFAPYYGLHRPENRRATVIFDVSGLDPAFLSSEVAWPILGSLYGREIGDAVGVVAGIASASRRRRAESVRRGFRLGRRRRPVPCGGRHAGSAGPGRRAASSAAASGDQRNGGDDCGFAPPPLHRDGHGRIDAVAIGSPHLSIGGVRAAGSADRRAQAQGAALCLHRPPCACRAGAGRPAQGAGSQPASSSSPIPASWSRRSCRILQARY